MKGFGRFIIAICLMALCAGGQACFAGEMAYDEVLKFAYDNDLSQMQFRPWEDDHIRAVYRIALPQDAQGVHEEIVQAYSGYEAIYLLEYGLADLGPIVQSGYCCVGVDAHGAMAPLMPPFGIRSRIYDFEAFSALSIEKIR